MIYLLPNIRLKEVKQHNIGKYGLLKLKYLKEHNKGLYTELLMNEQLNSYLYDIEKIVNNKINELIISLAEKKNINEKLKNDNQMLWVRHMNIIKNCAEEIVFRDYIYTELI
ncbi:MAG: TnpV protein [Ruminococcus sp.]|nr:TnpV protein [Ruminococcus sp.]